MKKNLIFTLVSLCLVIASFFTVIKPVFAVDAKGAIVINAESGEVLFSQNSSVKLPMASTTKVATLITVLENCKDLNQKVTVADEAVGIEGTSMYLRYDEELSIYELMLGAMLNSGNDACVALAYAVSGSEKDFCSLMNQMAVKAGAVNTNFENSHGLDQNNHYTTAEDLAKIFAYGLKYDTFKKIINIKHATVEPTNKFEKRYLTNKNRLIGTMQHYAGGKIGFTDNAGRCLASYYENNGIKLVCVVLNCYGMFDETRALFNQEANKLLKIKQEYEQSQKLPLAR